MGWCAPEISPGQLSGSGWVSWLYNGAKGWLLRMLSPYPLLRFHESIFDIGDMTHLDRRVLPFDFWCSYGNHVHWHIFQCWRLCVPMLSFFRLRSTPRDSHALHIVPFTMALPCWTTSMRNSFGRCWIISKSRARPLLGREIQWMSLQSSAIPD